MRIARVLPWLAVLVALTLSGAAIPVVHEHAGATPGLYNEECALERLAMAPGGVLGTTPPDATAPLPALVLPLPPDAPALPARPPLPSGSRAPPAA